MLPILRKSYKMCREKRPNLYRNDQICKIFGYHFTLNFYQTGTHPTGLKICRKISQGAPPHPPMYLFRSYVTHTWFISCSSCPDDTLWLWWIVFFVVVEDQGKKDAASDLTPLLSSYIEFVIRFSPLYLFTLRAPAVPSSLLIYSWHWLERGGKESGWLVRGAGKMQV